MNSAGCKKLPVRTRIKLAVTAPIIKGLFNILPRISDKFVISTVKKLQNENRYPAGQEFIEKAFTMLKEIFKTASPKCKKAIINNMIINVGIKGQQIRNSITKKIGFDIPILLAVSPTQRCPLKCYGCYAAEQSKDSDLKFEAFDRLIREAKDMGIFFFVITGGEPYIYDRMFEIFEKHSDVYFQTYTSAVTLTEKTGHIDRIAKLGNVLPCISIEGLEEETDKRRGKGHFERIEKAMAMLKERGVPFGFSGTATRENNDRLLSDEVMDHYIKKGCSVGYLFQYMPIGRAPVFDLVPTPEQRMFRYKRANEIRRTKPILLADFWCDGPLVGGCLAGGRRYLHINNLGNVEPCVFAQAYDMNIYEHSLMDVITKSKLLKEIRKRQPYSENLLRPCMIIDVPECWRESVKESNATFSYVTADNVANELKDKIEMFAKEYAELANPVWDKVYKKAYQKENDYVKGLREKFTYSDLDNHCKTAGK